MIGISIVAQPEWEVTIEYYNVSNNEIFNYPYSIF